MILHKDSPSRLFKRVGLPVFLGAKSTPFLAFSPIAGEAMRMTTANFQKQVAKGPLTALLHR